MKAEPNNREPNPPNNSPATPRHIHPLSPWSRGLGLCGWKVGAQLVLQEASEDRQNITNLHILRAQCMNESEKGKLEQLLRTLCTENGQELLVPQTHCIHLLPPQLGRQVVYKWYGHRS